MYNLLIIGWSEFKHTDLADLFENHHYCEIYYWGKYYWGDNDEEKDNVPQPSACEIRTKLPAFRPNYQSKSDAIVPLLSVSQK